MANIGKAILCIAEKNAGFIVKGCLSLEEGKSCLEERNIQENKWCLSASFVKSTLCNPIKSNSEIYRV